MPECLLCTEDREFMTVGECDHPVVCVECAYKLRVINENLWCGFCNIMLEEVIVTSEISKSYKVLNKSIYLEWYKAGICVYNKETYFAYRELENTKCAIGRCTKIFDCLENLTRHMKEAHDWYFCDLCLTHWALLISQ